MKSENILKSRNGFFEIGVRVNGVEKTLSVRAGESLLDGLRRHGYKSVKKGCDTGDCGSCAVILNGTAVLACLMPSVAANGCEITCVEGLGTVQKPHPLQEAFVEAGAVQCGFCIPGMILTAKHLLDRTPEPSDEQIRHALDGNLCRCTGYVKQVQAVKMAAKKIQKMRKR